MQQPGSVSSNRWQTCPSTQPKEARCMFLGFLRPALLLCLLSTVACEREKRDFNQSTPASAPVQSIQMTPQQPGPIMPAVTTTGPYAENAYSVSEGKRLYSAYNCEGCHFMGGGGMGPPLMDDRWIYGSDPANIFQRSEE